MTAVPMNIILDQLLDAYMQNGGELEEWQVLTVEVEACRKVEAAIKRGLEILAIIDEENDSWIKQVRDGGAKFYWHRAGEIAHRYNYWNFISSFVLNAVNECKNMGY